MYYHKYDKISKIENSSDITMILKYHTVNYKLLITK